MKKNNLLNIGVRLMHVVTSSQISFTYLYFNTFNKGGRECTGIYVKCMVVLYIYRKYMNDARH